MNKNFVHPHFIKKKSLTLPLSKEWYEQIKTEGWSIIQNKVGFRNYKPHYIRKAGLEVCRRCNSVVKSLQKSGFSKLCDSCYSKEKALLEEWNKKRQIKAGLKI